MSSIRGKQSRPAAMNKVQLHPWDARVRLKELPSLSTLSDDILVDQVFSYLDVEDIISLRQVSKLYYNLTHQGIIWKKFLKKIGPNAPQLPPSTRHSPRFLTSFEAERLVTRAITLQKNWTSASPHPLFLNSFQVHRLVQSMVVLPGGKYMVASVSNLAKTHYSLVVFALDHRIGGIVPLAETPAKQKAYNLTAKYMDINGTPSIVIAYIRRKIAPGYSDANINTSIYNSIWQNPRRPIDPPVPLQYVCTCLQISLGSLDALADPRLVPGSPEFFAFAASQPPPFRLLSVLRSTSELGVIDLAVVDGVPTMAVVKRFETVVFKELRVDGLISTLNCAREEQYSSNRHHICNLRILPQQSQVLAVRTTMLPPGPAPPPGEPPARDPQLISLSMFSLPKPGESEVENHLPDQFVSFRVDDVEGIQINDPSEYESMQDTNSTGGIVHPPINIFFRRNRGTQFLDMVIKPTPREFLPKRQSSKPHYSLGNLLTNNGHMIWWRHDRMRSECRAFVLPGTQRPLVYVAEAWDTAESPSVHAFYSHWPDVEGAEEYSTRKQDLLQSILRRPLTSRPKALCNFEMSQDLVASLRDGVKAIAWDEGIGRVWYIKPDDSQIHLIDFANAPIQAPNGQRWPLHLADERMLEL
ncbi:hypothetical protein HYDPIDRAFT_180871 [Hydnomerulius pinastri MD-312]|nr:hypothetical protein HYDPIDRAFT_180871 [Hydnomerulius pinastri MD-312]